MVDIAAPQPTDEICDPACGTAGFLIAAAEYVRREHPGVLTDATQRRHFHASMFHGYDFDGTMLRIGSMNMLLHGVESPDIRYRDSLSEGVSGEGEKYTLVLANPPFAGTLDYESTSKDLQRVVKTKKTELLFLALFLKLLKPGGRAAVIVPDGVLFGSSTAHKEVRRILVEDQKLDGVVKLPSGVFRPYAGVSTAILLFTKTNSGGTDDVWFYDVQADGFSLDDKRNPVEANDLPDALARWGKLGNAAPWLLLGVVVVGAHDGFLPPAPRGLLVSVTTEQAGSFPNAIVCLGISRLLHNTFSPSASDDLSSVGEACSGYERRAAG